MGYAGQLVASHYDGCEMPVELAPFDVEKVELYKGPGPNYTLVVYMCETQAAGEREWEAIPTYSIYIDYDLDKGTGEEGAEYVLSLTCPHEGGCHFSVTSGGEVLEFEEYSTGWNRTREIRITIPSYAFNPFISRLACALSADLREEISRTYSYRSHEIKDGEWLSLAEDDYDGLPIDLKSVEVMRKGTKLFIKYVFYTQLIRGDLPSLRLGFHVIDPYLETSAKEDVNAFILPEEVCYNVKRGLNTGLTPRS